MVGSDFSAAIGLAVLALAFPTCQGAFPAGATEISQVASSIYFASVLCLEPRRVSPAPGRANPIASGAGGIAFPGKGSGRHPREFSRLISFTFVTARWPVASCLTHFVTSMSLTFRSTPTWLPVGEGGI